MSTTQDTNPVRRPPFQRSLREGVDLLTGKITIASVPISTGVDWDRGADDGVTRPSLSVITP